MIHVHRHLPATVKWLLLFATLTLAAQAAATPMTLSHQGRLLDIGGTPLDGTFELDFRLYDAVTGGELLWFDVQDVDIDNGYYSVILNESGDSLIEDVLDQFPVYLELAVDGGDPLEPRLEITSVPYAAMAETATNVSGGVVDASEILVDGQTVVDADGVWQGEAPTVAWDEIVDVPTDFQDGYDADTLVNLTCVDGGGPYWDDYAGAWDCDLPIDSVLSEIQVESYVTNDALDLFTGTTIGGRTPWFTDDLLSMSWYDLADIPEGLEDDIDDDTLAGLACADGQVAAWDEGTGLWVCSTPDGGGVLVDDTVLDALGSVNRVGAFALLGQERLEDIEVANEYSVLLRNGGEDIDVAASAEIMGGPGAIGYVAISDVYDDFEDGSLSTERWATDGTASFTESDGVVTIDLGEGDSGTLTTYGGADSLEFSIEDGTFLLPMELNPDVHPSYCATTIRLLATDYSGGDRELDYWHETSIESEIRLYEFYYEADSETVYTRYLLGADSLSPDDDASDTRFTEWTSMSVAGMALHRYLKIEVSLTAGGGGGQSSSVVISDVGFVQGAPVTGTIVTTGQNLPGSTDAVNGTLWLRKETGYHSTAPTNTSLQLSSDAGASWEAAVEERLHRFTAAGDEVAWSYTATTPSDAPVLITGYVYNVDLVDKGF